MRMGWGGITALRDAGGQSKGFSYLQTVFESAVRDAAMCFFHPSKRYKNPLKRVANQIIHIQQLVCRGFVLK